LNILHISTYDCAGGAEKIAFDLRQLILREGHRADLLVGKMRDNTSGVFRFDHEPNRALWTRFWNSTTKPLLKLEGKRCGATAAYRFLNSWIGQPRRTFRIWKGEEDFDFPGTEPALEAHIKDVDVVHCHNLHGGYFDLRCLPWLCAQKPVVLTLHDAWLLSGHCCHSFKCDRWKTGCGQCPDLHILPSINQDSTAFNWDRKKSIYEKCRLHLVTPSHWLHDRVKESILVSGTESLSVIPNGVDLNQFKPDRENARNRLGIPQTELLICFLHSSYSDNMWKDTLLLRKALSLIPKQINGRIIGFLVVGGSGTKIDFGSSPVHQVGRLNSQGMADCLAAADTYVHPARADTYPTICMESLACGTPVVATSVGGIPEIVKHLETGILTKPGDAEEMGLWLTRLLESDTIRKRLATDGMADSLERFDQNHMVAKYIDIYNDAINSFILHQNRASKRYYV
jgi:glycosyltransferase involved in cell wall biosynthesis